MERRAAAKQANVEAARERKEREAKRAEEERLQRERNNLMVPDKLQFTPFTCHAFAILKVVYSSHHVSCVCLN